MQEVGLYIHIPFCKKKCGYCSFNSGVDFSVCKDYFEALNLEITNFSKINDLVVDSIFLGGGTPTCVAAEYIEKILKTVHSNYKIENAEITIECNPESLTKSKVESYLKYGVNRFSVGVQSLNDKLLKTVGRVHDSKTALNALKLLKNFNVSDINCDIMLNLPGQTLDDIFFTVDKLMQFDIAHLSAYSLSLEENTPMCNKCQLDEDRAADYYENLVEYLKQFNLYRYEVSNFSKPGFECRHNLKYWKRCDYYGFGVAAHSLYKNYRYENCEDVNKYIDKLKNNLNAFNVRQKIEKHEQELEYLICNFRLEHGFKLSEFKKLFEADFLVKYEARLKKVLPHLITDKENIKINPQSFYILNSILTEII